MAKWEQWIDDEFEDELELTEDYQSFQPIRKKKKSPDDDSGQNKGNKKNKNSKE